MRPYFTEHFYNPSSPYTPARRAALAIEAAREQVASLVGSEPDEVVFTSGGTESNVAAIHHARLRNPGRRHWVCSAVEHASVLEPMGVLEREGHRVTRVPVDRQGRMDLAALEAALTSDTALVSVMTANNETGVIYPVAEIAAMCRARGIPVHADAVQSVGRMPVSFRDLGLDYMTCCAHKMHGPKGVGALILRRGAPAFPLLRGGGQEAGRRAGTENVPALVGFGRAAELARDRMQGASANQHRLRALVEEGVCAELPDCIVVGQACERLPNTTLFLLPGLDTDVVLAALDLAGVCCSSGSACASGSAEPSHVLRAMGWGASRPVAAVRVSWGRMSTEHDAIRLVSKLCDGVRVIRARAAR